MNRCSKPVAGYSFVYSRLVSRDGTVVAVNDDFRHVTSTFQNVTQHCVAADRALPVNPACDVGGAVASVDLCDVSKLWKILCALLNTFFEVVSLCFQAVFGESCAVILILVGFGYFVS